MCQVLAGLFAHHTRPITKPTGIGIAATVFQMEKLRPSKMRILVQGHSVSGRARIWALAP